MSLPRTFDANETAEKVAFLARVDAFGLGTGMASVRETRTSWVFLTADRVFKLKKPIRNGMMDFTTPEARRRNGEEEIRLNRRLAPDIYLGLVPLNRTQAGILTLARTGEPVDWLVEMRRLPEAGFLDTAIRQGHADRTAIEALGRRLAAFYRSAEPVQISPAEYGLHVRQEILGSRRILLNTQFGLSRSRVDRVLGAQLRFAGERFGALARRAAGQHIVEGQGDLRPEHVWLSDTPLVIDCLEFSRALRTVDPFDEIAYLGLECERLGAAWIGRVLLEKVSALLPGRPDTRTLAFYRSVRACLSASFALRHYLEPARREPARWRFKALEYLAIAERDITRL